MATVKITVRDRIAIVEAGVELVCNNPTDTIEFDFDEEWSAHNTKTARFSWEGRYIDVVFDGNTVEVPEIYRTSYVFVGVFSNGITTTPAKVPTRFSIKCYGGKVKEPHPDVYEQILEKLNAGGGSGSNSEYTQPEWGYKEAYILPETDVTLAPNEEIGGMVAAIIEPSTLTGTLSVGNEYIISYAGTDYACVFSEAEPMGNGSVFGMEDTGEPFCMLYENGMLILMPVNQLERTVKFSISGKVVKPIESEYAPEIPYLDLVDLGLGTVGAGLDVVTINYDYTFYVENIKPKLGANLRVKMLLNHKGYEPFTYTTAASAAARNGEKELILHRGLSEGYGYVLYYTMVDMAIITVEIGELAIRANEVAFAKSALGLETT